MKKILVCEDEAAIRDFVVINLTRAGYEVVEADCGEAALQNTIAAHPRFAMLALQHRWATPARRLKIQWRKLAAAAPTRKCE